MISLFNNIFSKSSTAQTLDAIKNQLVKLQISVDQLRSHKANGNQSVTNCHQLKLENALPSKAQGNKDIQETDKASHAKQLADKAADCYRGTFSNPTIRQKRDLTLLFWGTYGFDPGLCNHLINSGLMWQDVKRLRNYNIKYIGDLVGKNFKTFKPGLRTQITDILDRYQLDINFKWPSHNSPEFAKMLKEAKKAGIEIVE